MNQTHEPNQDQNTIHKDLLIQKIDIMRRRLKNMRELLDLYRCNCGPFELASKLCKLIEEENKISLDEINLDNDTQDVLANE